MAHHDKPRARRATVSVIGLITACALAGGCGSNSDGSTSNSGFAAESLAYSKCIRTHGVPAYLDPTFPPSGGIAVTDPPGVDLQSPAYEHASAQCGNR